MYRNIINAFGLKAMIKNPQIPDYHLMVGSAEELGSLPLLVYTNTSVPKEVVDNMNRVSEMNNEQLYSALAYGGLEVNDLNYNIATLPIGEEV